MKRAREDHDDGGETYVPVDKRQRPPGKCPEPRRLVMIKLECHFDDCDHAYDPNALHEHTTDFVPNALYGVFYCNACGQGRTDEIHTKVRNSGVYGKCLRAETICPADQIDYFGLRVKRTSGTFEDGWTLLPWGKFLTHGSGSRAPLRIVDDNIYVEVVRPSGLSSISKTCTLDDLLEWNPKWRPVLDLSSEPLLSEKNAAVWRNAMRTTVNHKPV